MCIYAARQTFVGYVGYLSYELPLVVRVEQLHILDFIERVEAWSTRGNAR